MKLLYCPDCRDIFNLDYHEKSCSCGKTKGKYLDNINAEFTGGIPLCISNQSFAEAFTEQKVNDREHPLQFYGSRFEAWICPANSESFRKVDNG